MVPDKFIRLLSPSHPSLLHGAWRPALFALLLCTALPLRAGEIPETPLDLPPKVHHALIEGMEELYNYEFKKANATLSSVQNIRDEHPIVAFALASAHWWRLSIFVLEPNEDESAPFLQAVDAAIEAAETKMDKDDPTAEGNLALGGSLGLWGRWEATNRNWLSAYFKGKKAMKILRRGIEKNPELYDAYMGLGMFDYYVATLPSVVRVLAFLGATGDKNQGIRELHIAAEKSAYAKVPSSLFLIDIYANMENQPDKAFDMAARLREEYPRSPIINLLQCTSLYNNDKIEEMDECSSQFVENARTGRYVPLAKTQAYWSRGSYFFKSRQWEEAIEQFDRAISLKKKIDAYYVFSHLFKGYALDALGRREEAVEQYKIVLEEQRRWNSHENAKIYLKDPFTVDDAQMKKVRL